MAKNSLSLPDNVVQALAAADKARGFPAGTMASLMAQESDSRFLADPTLPHYPTGVAPNGKKSSAFGPFGILESTGRDPGYGVKPLANKTFEEQLRFSADYLDARSRSAGSLSAGLAGYGEGEKYSRQVERRRDGGTAPVVVAQAPQPAPVVAQDSIPANAPVVMAQAPEPAPITPAPVADPQNDPWVQFQQRTQAAGLMPEGMAYGQVTTAPAQPTRAPPGMSPEEVAELYNIPLNAPLNFGLRRPGRKTA